MHCPCFLSPDLSRTLQCRVLDCSPLIPVKTHIAEIYSFCAPPLMKWGKEAFLIIKTRSSLSIKHTYWSLNVPREIIEFSKIQRSHYCGKMLKRIGAHSSRFKKQTLIPNSKSLIYFTIFNLETLIIVSFHSSEASTGSQKYMPLIQSPWLII